MWLTDFILQVKDFFRPTEPVIKPAITDLSYLTDYDVVAKTIWGEARGEGLNGMTGVACVIQNRAHKGGWWGRTPREVCLKPMQFSCWNKDDPNRAKLLAVTQTDSQYQIALSLSNGVLTGTLADITDGATSYQVRGTNAWWAKGKTPVASIGTQDFYRV